ncbi:RNA polymerase sigma factor [Bordetella ansorpii]|uniref:RNA polymerase sigma factor n=1 Tax=Bordetella ansorpii TaxID=288768 RepID=A0A157SRE4_9BORD|nr:RNA polymerase sigma factor [Bordetella ansorpii]SAI73002.1 RNA polymerase sigma factor [Bordetella ansorpii]
MNETSDTDDPHCPAPTAVSAAPLQDALVAHYDWLSERLNRFLSCSDLAMESLHETWLKVVTMPVPTSPIRQPRAYLFRLACNLALDRLRADSGYGRRSDEGEAFLHEIPDERQGPMEQTEARAALRNVSQALKGLSTRQQAILIDARIEQRPYHEIEQRYGIARSVLRRELRDAQQFCLSQIGDTLLELPRYHPKPHSRKLKAHIKRQRAAHF